MPCLNCGYCCRHYHLDKTPLNIILEAADLEVPLAGPCNHLYEKEPSVFLCKIYNVRPSFCALGPKFDNVSFSRLEELAASGKEFPRCLFEEMKLGIPPKMP